MNMSLILINNLVKKRLHITYGINCMHLSRSEAGLGPENTRNTITPTYK